MAAREWRGSVEIYGREQGVMLRILDSVVTVYRIMQNGAQLLTLGADERRIMTAVIAHLLDRPSKASAAGGQATKEHYRIYEYQGKKYTLTELAAAHGMSRVALSHRINGLGWTPAAAVTIPLGPGPGKKRPRLPAIHKQRRNRDDDQGRDRGRSSAAQVGSGNSSENERDHRAGGPPTGEGNRGDVGGNCDGGMRCGRSGEDPTNGRTTDAPTVVEEGNATLPRLRRHESVPEYMKRIGAEFSEHEFQAWHTRISPGLWAAMERRAQHVKEDQKKGKVA